LKLGRTALTNTDKHLLRLLEQVGWVTASALVRATYAKSKQIDKKAETYTKRLRRLQRFGHVREIRGAWALTRKGGSPDRGRGLRLVA
jgi:hypothetical protein